MVTRTATLAWKLPLLDRRCAAPFSGKPSTPYGAGPVHDFMHAKLTVVDDVVFTGSYNLSRSGERNAENVLEIEDAALADRLAALRGRGPSALPPLTPSREGVAMVPGGKLCRIGPDFPLGKVTSLCSHRWAGRHLSIATPFGDASW